MGTEELESAIQELKDSVSDLSITESPIDLKEMAEKIIDQIGMDTILEAYLYNTTYKQLDGDEVPSDSNKTKGLKMAHICVYGRPKLIDDVDESGNTIQRDFLLSDMDDPDYPWTSHWRDNKETWEMGMPEDCSIKEELKRKKTEFLDALKKIGKEITSIPAQAVNYIVSTTTSIAAVANLTVAVPPQPGTALHTVMSLLTMIASIPSLFLGLLDALGPLNLLLVFLPVDFLRGFAAFIAVCVLIDTFIGVLTAAIKAITGGVKIISSPVRIIKNLIKGLIGAAGLAISFGESGPGISGLVSTDDSGMPVINTDVVDSVIDDLNTKTNRILNSLATITIQQEENER